MRRTVGISCLVVVGLVAICTGCASSGDKGNAGAQPQPSNTSSRGPAVSVVAIGDSDATGIGDATSRGWVGRYGDLLTRQLGRPVAVDNRAVEGQTSDQLRTDMRQNDALRKAVADSDVVLIGIGGADLNAGDDALSAGDCNGKGCYTQVLSRFGANISAIAAEVRHLAPHALVRAMSLPNAFPGAGSVIPPFITSDISRYEATTERASVCQAMRSYGGRCIDVVTAFNGPRADGDAYATGLMTKDPCCYASGKGQQLIAQLLVESGVNGLPESS
jgi:lysophospholipase L1-like esterase